ncbi:CAF17-like 4Fe-4S cluster assembly/insertion protein YgfZ [Uliginosibacterium sp. H1]|uniref:CAF17-like 4Fe-4S cluster assembly/insertion protein YgfZ n=1 Tax=Uliginosibacterium sp. H1 TaxID=3114757 RepID=UPI002E1909E6|nr:folate-binding protein [Uliginosibacterium sp. H1]
MQSPWLVHLDETGARFLEGGSGAVQFGDPREEVRAAERGTVVVPLTHLGLLRAEGEDASPFLHNLMSNDIKKLDLHRAQWNSFNSPKGRMLASFLVWRDANGFRLLLSADLLSAIHKKLGMYVLRSKVRVTDGTPELALIGLSGAAAATALDSAGIPLPPPEGMSVSHGSITVVRIDASRLVLAAPLSQCAELWRKLVAAGAQPAGTDAWRWLDIRAGVPVITAATQDEFVAQMINFELIGGVNFQKGCYPGQEIVARTQYLGKLKKRMYFAHIDTDTAPAAGADLYAPEFGEQSSGKLVSVAPAPQGGYDVLAVTQIASRESGNVHLGSLSGPVLQFGELPYTVG